MHGLPSNCLKGASSVAAMSSVLVSISLSARASVLLSELCSSCSIAANTRHDHPKPTLVLNLQLTAVRECLSSCQTLPLHRMCNLLMANQAGTELGPRSFDGAPHNLYINRDSVESLHHLLNVQVGYSAANVPQDLPGKSFCVPPESNQNMPAGLCRKLRGWTSSPFWICCSVWERSKECWIWTMKYLMIGCRCLSSETFWAT